MANVREDPMTDVIVGEVESVAMCEDGSGMLVYFTTQDGRSAHVALYKGQKIGVRVHDDAPRPDGKVLH